MSTEAPDQPEPAPPRVALATIAREWGRIGCIGFGGPPAHIALLRKLCVSDRAWLSDHEFEDGIAACNLLPGPASTQLAIFCAWRLRGPAGAVLGGFCFIAPGLVVILGLASVFLAARPPGWIQGAAEGAGAAVPAVAVAAAVGLLPGSWRRAGSRRAGRARWCGYLLAGGLASATVGPWLVLVLAACGLIEVVVAIRASADRALAALPLGLPLARLPSSRLSVAGLQVARARMAGMRVTGVRMAGLRMAGVRMAGLRVGTVAALPAAGGLLALAWVAFKVGALSYGGGFVIIPLIQHDAVGTYHWMTATQFLGAVALGQVTPGPVVLTVAVVGYAAAGVGGGLLAVAVAFAPSFAFVLGGGRYFDRLRGNARVQAFLTGAGAASIGAIAGAAVPLGLALVHLWQLGVLALAAGWLFALRRGVVGAIVGGAALGIVAFLAGAPVGA
jgi:chromate transporter